MHHTPHDNVKTTIAKGVFFEVYTDSYSQLGGVVTQSNRLLAFFSWKPNKAQQKFSVTKQELLAIVEIQKAFKGMLLG